VLQLVHHVLQLVHHVLQLVHQMPAQSFWNPGRLLLGRCGAAVLPLLLLLCVCSYVCARASNTSGSPGWHVTNPPALSLSLSLFWVSVCLSRSLARSLSLSLYLSPGRHVTNPRFGLSHTNDTRKVLRPVKDLQRDLVRRYGKVQFPAHSRSCSHVWARCS